MPPGGIGGQKRSALILRESGCCSFSCPARRPLVQVNKLAKAMLNKYNAEQKEAAEKKAAKEKEKEAV